MSNDPTPGDPMLPEAREGETEPEELRQRLRAGARAARPGLAPETPPEPPPAPEPPAPEPPELEPPPEGPPSSPWAIRASWTAYVLELMVLGIPVSLAVRWLMERLGSPITGPWGPDDWVCGRTGLGPRGAGLQPAAPAYLEVPEGPGGAAAAAGGTDGGTDGRTGPGGEMTRCRITK